MLVVCKPPLRPLRDSGTVCGRAAVAAHEDRVKRVVHGHDSASGMEIAPCLLRDGGQALGSADRQAVGCSKSRDLVRQCHNSRIHESRSSSLARARSLSGGLLGARGVGAVSAVCGSAWLPAVRTRSYADVAASACGMMAVMHTACT